MNEETKLTTDDEEQLLDTVKREVKRGWLSISTARRFDTYKRKLAETEPHVLCHGKVYLVTTETLQAEGVEIGETLTEDEIRPFLMRHSERSIKQLPQQIAEEKGMKKLYGEDYKERVL